jgi:hypothetical protein
LPPYLYRGYEIVIAVVRTVDRVRVETEIVLPSAVEERIEHVAGDGEPVRTLALADINDEALLSAKRTVDVLVAELSALTKRMR